MAGPIGNTTMSIRAGGARWRRCAELIHQYLRREMRDAEDQRKKIYEKTWESQIQRTVPLIWRVARELATLYLRPPAREFVGAEPAQLELIERVYRDAKVNRRLRTAQEHLSVLGNATVWVWLTSEGFRLLVPPIHDQWAWSGRVDGSEVEDIVEWRVRFPVVTDPMATSVPTAVALITPERAVWESGPKGWEGTGIWAKSGANPFGRIPVVLFRSSDPAPGEFFAPVPEDLLDAQRAVNHDFTDRGTIARKQGFSQAYVEGLTQTQANEMEVGPESLAGVPAGGKFGYASPDANLDGYGRTTDDFIKLVIACSGMSPATVMKSTGITALAKIVENIDREVERQRAKDEFEPGEDALYDFIAQAKEIRSGGVATIPRKIHVKVAHREPVMPADPMNDAQAKSLRIALAVDCAASIIAAEKAIPLDEAQGIALKNVELTNEITKSRVAAPTTPTPNPTPATTAQDGSASTTAEMPTPIGSAA